MQRAAIFAFLASSALASGCTVASGADEGDSEAPGTRELVAEAAAADHAALAVDFAGCREVANAAEVPTNRARPLVPRQFTLVGEGAATTPFVVRTVHCASIS